MGCEQCKLLDVKKRENDENVIANVSADCANQCENAAIKEEATANSISITSPINQSPNLANEPRTAQMEELETTAASTNQSRNVTSLSLVELADLDSNILNSTEQLEVHDEICDLAAATAATCSVDDDTSISAVDHTDQTTSQSAEQHRLPDNRLKEVEEEADSTVTSEDVSSSGAPIRKKRGTVRVNSVRGHKVSVISNTCTVNP